MNKKTKVEAQESRQEILVTRDFDLPVELLFRAYSEAEFLEQWMGTKVIKLENKNLGYWEFKTTDAEGNILFAAHGAIHEFTPYKRIVRTFEMSNAQLEPQLEFLEFEPLTDATSRFRMQIVYRSVADRDQVLQWPFEQGLNMAHNRLQEIANNLK